jgi:hypothetical protein
MKFILNLFFHPLERTNEDDDDEEESQSETKKTAISFRR